MVACLTGAVLQRSVAVDDFGVGDAGGRFEAVDVLGVDAVEVFEGGEEAVELRPGGLEGQGVEGPLEETGGRSAKVLVIEQVLRRIEAVLLQFQASVEAVLGPKIGNSYARRDSSAEEEDRRARRAEQGQVRVGYLSGSHFGLPSLVGEFVVFTSEMDVLRIYGEFRWQLKANGRYRIAGRRCGRLKLNIV